MTKTINLVKREMKKLQNYKIVLKRSPMYKLKKVLKI